MTLQQPETDNWSVAPFWKIARTEPQYSLNSNETCDVLIIGAGITGLATAFSLCERKKVIVVDAKQIGEGSTGWSAGILSQATTIDLSTSEELLGDEQARSLTFFVADAILKARSSTAWEKNDWQAGSSLYFAARKSHEKMLTEEYNLRHKYGLPTEFLQGGHLKFWKNYSTMLEMSGEHGVHPIKLLLGLAAAVRKAGSKVYERSAFKSYQHNEEDFTAQVGNQEIRAQHIVICTGMEMARQPGFNDLIRMSVPVTGHVLVTAPSDEFTDFVKNTNRIAAWDSLHLYHYIRYFNDGRILIGGEESPGITKNTALDTGDSAIRRLHAWAQKHHRKTLPPAEFAWRASLSIPADGLPAFKLKTKGDNLLIGAVTDGIPFAFVLGAVIAQLIQTGEHPLSRLLSHRRPAPAPARMLSMLPEGPIRSAALKAAFAGMNALDALPF
jgi:glycine/D-amino acid oxidase-like deaminating enzyme